ncbi:MAG: DUF4340 domain-containing protein [Pseudobdellovibrionaceae bacterium]
MKKKKLMGFAALVAVVVGYAVYDFQSSKIEDERKSENNYLIPVDADEIRQFQIHSTAADVEVVKEKEGWKVVKPLQEMADQKASDDFVEGLVTEKMTEVATEGSQVDFAIYGLDQPLGNISVTTNKGDVFNFTVGKQKNFEGQAFLRKNNETKVLVVSSTWFPKFEKTLLDFRDKRLMRFPNSQVEKLQFETRKERFQLTKKEMGWVLDSHPEWNLDQNKVRELLGMLNTTNAIEFIAEGAVSAKELNQWKLTSPMLKLMAVFKDGKKWTARFAMGPDHVHRVQVSEPVQVLKISPQDSDKFYQMTAESFRDRSEPFQFDKSNVKKIEIKLGSKSGVLPMDDERARTLLEKLRGLSLAEYNGSGKAQFENEILLRNDEKDVFQLQWGDLQKSKVNSGEAKVYFAKSSAFPQTFTILESDINSLNLNELINKEKAP